MRNFFILIFSLTTLCACQKSESVQAEQKPIIDIAPQRDQLQQARELEHKMQVDAENQRKAIELQTNPK